MNKLNASVYHIQIPDKMKRLPISRTGYPIPWFVATDPATGERDFRVADQGRLYDAVKRSLCWLCGQQLGVHKVFVLGPMCVVNRTTSEPPSHLECAQYAVKACPFLTQPRMRRNEVDMPAAGVAPPGVALRRNPGAVAVWVTRTSEVMRLPGGILFKVGEPERIDWVAEGRKATREEIIESMRTGIPSLERLAKEGGPEDEALLAQQIHAAEGLLPPL